MRVDSQDYCDPAVSTGLDSTPSDDGEDSKGRVFACTMCSYRTDRKNNLKRHTFTMHELSPAILECCGLRFLNKAELRLHTHKFHRDGYHCDVCGRVFCRKALLKRHYSVHSGYKEFSCQLCGYETSHKSNLERHLRVHRKDGSSSSSSSSSSCSVPPKSAMSPSVFPHVDFNASAVRNPEVNMQTSESPSGAQLPFVTSAPTHNPSPKQLLPSPHPVTIPSSMLIRTPNHQQQTPFLNTSAPILSDWESWQRAVYCPQQRCPGFMMPHQLQNHPQPCPQVPPYWSPGLKKIQPLEALQKSHWDDAPHHFVLPLQRGPHPRADTNFGVSALLSHNMLEDRLCRRDRGEEQEVNMKSVENSVSAGAVRPHDCGLSYGFRGTAASELSSYVPMDTQREAAVVRTFAGHHSFSNTGYGFHPPVQQNLQEDSGASSGYGSPGFEESRIHCKTSMPNDSDVDEDEIIDVDGYDENDSDATFGEKKEVDETNGTRDSQVECSWETSGSVDMDQDTGYVPKKLRVSKKFRDSMGSMRE